MPGPSKLGRSERGKVLARLIVLSLLAWACAASAEQKPKDKECLACHADPTLTAEVNGKQVSLYVDESKLKHSIHGGMFACVDCHKDVKGLVHETTPRKIRCAECHADAQEAYSHSLHAKEYRAGGPGANCQDCHGGAHEILAADDAKSPVNHANIPVTCGRCHGQKFLMESNGESAQPFISYQESVHGRAVENGSLKAAVCTDCHGAHEILSASNPKSPISKFNVPATCGKCHAAIEQTFNQSIHGQAIARGNQLAPVCTDCHGIHSIKSPGEPQLAGFRAECLPRYLRPLPRGRAAFAGVWRAGRTGGNLLRQLSRAGGGRRLGGRGQLLQLPRRA